MDLLCSSLQQYVMAAKTKMQMYILQLNLNDVLNIRTHKENALANTCLNI